MLLFASSATITAQVVAEPTNIPAEWSRPYQPFRIAGNLYYVGTSDLACYLVVTNKGNILINTGLASSAPMIQASIEKLGFKWHDTRILLTTQAHYDHMGAMAAIKKSTGAKVMVDEGDAGVLADGGRSDYALGGDTSTYAPLKADRLLRDGDTVALGNAYLRMLHHPGHTKGSCSFLLDVKDDRRSYRVLIANMPTIVTDKAFTDIPAYPAIEKDYEYTFAAMKKLQFDLWVASHASQFGLHKKRKQGDRYNPGAFSDRKGYDAALKDLERQFLKKVKGRK
ncbi:subclass B3 metallo-beta-lactamase [Segetibacter sp. 3557_3]|nr:subclass B3 metallo-beta-lactamase [Segetibacter sp. 3557_3]